MLSARPVSILIFCVRCISRREAELVQTGQLGWMQVPARSLSGGEQQKLAIIGALASQPEVLFLIVRLQT